MVGKLNESSFQNRLRFVHMYFLEEVTTVLVIEGHTARKSDFLHELMFCVHKRPSPQDLSVKDHLSTIQHDLVNHCPMPHLKTY